MIQKKSIPYKEVFWVALGGMAGALLREATNRLISDSLDGILLLTATAIENIIGSFLIGVIYYLLAGGTGKNRVLSLFLLTGIIGSYTTYSGFMIEAFLYMDISITTMMLYLFSQILTGIMAVVIGAILAKKWLILKKNKK